MQKPNVATVVLHWLTACLILLALTAGLYAVYYSSGCCGSDRNTAFLLHAYAGLSVLGIVVLRLAFRVFFPWPHAPGRRKFDIGAIVANHVHWGLYIMMVLLPLTGWIVASGMGCCMAVPGLPDVANLAQGIRNRTHSDVSAAYQAHVVIAWSMIVWVFAHVMAALFHHFVIKDNALRSMLPGRLFRKTAAATAPGSTQVAPGAGGKDV